MTEEEWLKCTDAEEMRVFLLAGRRRYCTRTGPRSAEEEALYSQRVRLPPVTDRKLRLFACACCRRIWHLLTEPRSRIAVEVSERYADGLATDEERAIAQQTGQPSYVFHSDPSGDPAKYAAHPDAETAMDAGGSASHFLSYVMIHAARKEQREDKEWETECQFPCNYLRDIFGCLPFRPVVIADSWLTPTVHAIATACYAHRTFDVMPILADALEEAGCDNADILNHCRQSGEHLRGCWVLDLILGNE